MRALAVAPEPFFTPRGTPLSVYYRTMVMAEQGVEVDLLTYGEGEEVDLPGVHIHRIPHPQALRPVPVGPSLRKGILDVPLLLRMADLLRRNRYDFVHAHEEAVFFCLLLQPLFGFRFVYDMHSSLPQQLVNFGFTRSRILIGLFRYLEGAALRRADAVVTISPALAEHALSRMPDPRPHFLIENSLIEGVQLRGREVAVAHRRVARVGGSSRGELSGRHAHGGEDAGFPRGRPVVAYAGTFEEYQGLELLLEAFRHVRERVPGVVLWMVGGSPTQVERYREMAARKGVEGSCTIRGRLGRRLVQTCLQRADVLVSPRLRGTNTPLKIYEQLASGVPLVATRILSHTQVLDDEVCFLVEPTPRGLADGIVAALEAGERRDRIVRRALELYERRYSREAYERKVSALLDHMRAISD